MSQIIIVEDQQQQFPNNIHSIKEAEFIIEENKHSPNSLEEDFSKDNNHQPLSLHNWKHYLFDENTFTDIMQFEDWQINMDFDGSEILEKDLTRTRSQEEYFQRPHTKLKLKLMAAFYCYSNKVNYQQGLLEIIAPFLLLQRKDFKLSRCYAYFNAFMKKYFPKFLVEKIIAPNNEKGLPHTFSAMYLCRILLQYHNSQIMNIFEKAQCDLSTCCTQWFMTLFSKNTKIQYALLIIDFFMQKKNVNYIFYLSVALIVLKEKEIIELSQQDDDEIMMFFNKQIKTLNSEEDLQNWFAKAQEIEQKTPKSFELFSQYIGFNENSILSKEDINTMINLNQNQESYLNKFNYAMPFYSFELIQYFQEQNLIQNKDDKNSNLVVDNQSIESNLRKFNIQIIDCRMQREYDWPLSMKIPMSKINNQNSIKSLQKYFFEHPISPNVHLCILISKFSNQQEILNANKVIKYLLEQNRNYLSFIVGGNKALNSYLQKIGIDISNNINNNREECILI